MADKSEQNAQMSRTFTGVEHSDGRLAAAEEAKRTGLEFRSTSSKGAEIVPYDVAVEAGNEWSKQVVEERKEFDDLSLGTQEIIDLNEEKAKAHEEYSARVIEKRRETERPSQGEVVKAILERNEEASRQHEEISNARADKGRSGEERRSLTAEQMASGEPVTLMGREVKDKVTDISEAEERKVFQDRAQIAFGEKSLKNFADENKSAKETQPEKREVPEPRKSDEPKKQPKPKAKKEEDKSEAKSSSNEGE